MPTAFFIVAIVGALFTVNAYLPARRPEPFSVPSFFAGWLTSELPIHHIVWQAIATAVFVALGALHGWPGWTGLAITLASWVGLVELAREASRADDVVEEALREGLGAGYRQRIDPELAESEETGIAWRRLVLPFRRRDPEVQKIPDVVFHTDGKLKLKLDVFRNRSHPTGAPVLLYIHGGGWVIGDKREQGFPMMLHLAAHGWVCVTANYRLSPKATFPDHIVDVKRALAWVKENVAEYGGDPDFVVVSGGSAGGHLAALAGLTENDPEYQPGFEAVDTSMVACVPIYGVYDFTNREGAGSKGMRRFLERVVMKSKLAEARDEWEKASPMYRVREDAPPFLILHGKNDTLVPVRQARLFVRLLRERARGPVVYAELPGAQHAFELFRSIRTAHVVAGIERFLAVVRSDARRGALTRR